MTKRVKKVSRELFEQIQAREWRPVQLEGDFIPPVLRGIPLEKIYSIVASGTLEPGLAYSDEVIPSGVLVGGIDVYRNAPDDPVNLNKDWYAVVSVPETDTIY